MMTEARSSRSSTPGSATRPRRSGVITSYSIHYTKLYELLARRGADLDSERTERLFRESEGLPFFVSEYLTAQFVDGVSSYNFV